MADEQHELRRINWAETFSWTHIFKSFKMAIHPSKLVLALAAIIVLFCLGWVMDQFWAMTDQYVREGEIYAHFSQPGDEFDDSQERWKRSRLDRAAALAVDADEQKYTLSNYKAKLPRGHLKDAFSAKLSKANDEIKFSRLDQQELKQDRSYDELLAAAAETFSDEIARIEELLPPAIEEAKTAIKEDLKGIQDRQNRKLRRKALDEQLVEHSSQAKQAITRRKVEFARTVNSIRGENIFASLQQYERRCISNALAAVRYGNIFGGLQDYRNKLARRAISPQTAKSMQPINVPPPAPADDRAGFFYWVLLAVHGLAWLMAEHWLYAAVFLVVSLAVIAIFGGAVHRIAALHFAREEKISPIQALRFSCGKFLSFFTAPLIPLAVILGLAVAFLTVGGLIGSIPLAGNVIMGALFFLAIIVGLVIAFLLVGLIAGAPLMYPTIAVEGSDSFDAISRSFSYVFARPWRAALYGLVALVYGVVTYIFVRLFVFVALASTHYFVKWGVIGSGDRLHAAADKLDVMWSAPTFENLCGETSYAAMTGTMPIGGWLISVWVFIAAAAVSAFLLSYAASSTTVIYCLLRRKVDATELDDVYIEEEPEAQPGEQEPTPPSDEAQTEAEQPAEKETPPPAKEKPSGPKAEGKKKSE